jgi:hypothetical protein
MNNPWKVVTIGLGVAAVTALTSGLTTAYLLHAGTPAASGEAERRPATLAGFRAAPPAESTRPPIVHVTRTSPVARPSTMVRTQTPPAAASTIEPLPAPVAAAAPEAVTPTPVVSAPQPAVASTAPAVATTQPVDCATGGDRAMRIAKPGAIGALLGAGLGAVGGAIAGGGKGAGKGAMWGGLAGVAAGSAYGAYTTKQECGTILGGQDTSANSASPSRVVGGAPMDNASRPIEAPFTAPSADDRITIYHAR